MRVVRPGGLDAEVTPARVPGDQPETERRDHRPMDALRVGRSLRALRIRRGWRQSDVARLAGLSPSQCSRIERGQVASVRLGDIEAVCAAFGADLDVRVRWHGEGLDRLLDAAHADLVDRIVRLLASLRWDVAVEASFNHFGERGSVDVLAWHAAARALLVEEVKSVIADAQSIVGTLDRKTRLASAIGRERGWDPAVVGTLLVVADTSTARHRVESLRALFAVAYPARTVATRRWLRDPAGPLAALMFLRNSPQGRRMGIATGRQRVRVARRLRADH